ncbi:MAG: AAA domain-containing protein [Clostridiales bacterium]|nr:AAA domain-containing protein [Clostridiales bacterium]
MEMCARCHKRVAVVYVTKIENGETITEGICLKCAKELGIKPVNDILEKMGVSGDDLDEISDQFTENMQNMIPTPESDGDGETPPNPMGGAPAMDIAKLFRSFGVSSNKRPENSADSNKEGKRDEKKDTSRDARKQGKLKYLTTYCQNLNQKALDGKIDTIVGRERELDRIVQILSRRQKNNPCLIGEPGVGKTAIAEALAQKIAQNNVPDKLLGKQIYLVDLTAIVAGTQFRGQFESRMLGLINEVKEQGNAILVIDEVHNIAGAGDAEGSMNAANILKPALSRGEIQVIGATTLDEYRKYIEKDSALERRFQPVMVDEPSIEDSQQVILGIKHYYEEFHQVKIPDDIARRAVTLAERYITDRFLPDKAIDLIDEASAHVSLTSPVLNEYNKVAAELESAKNEREQLEQKSDDDVERYQRIAELQTAELQLSDKLKSLEAAKESVEVTLDDLASVIEIWTGVPATTIGENEFLRLDKLEARLKEHIVGQDEAVSAVVRAIKRGRAGVSYKRKPVSFIFAGPTGVGKTELVKTIATDLFNSPDALIRLDMTEYMEKHAVSKIIGSPPGYVGYDEAGQLTEKIRRKPYSVVLLDEIEKAHPDVLNILLQVLDDGKITDSHGKVVNFENAILVMTTNAGSSTGSGYAGFGTNAASMAENKTEKALSEFLRPEFINRVDEIVTFRALEEADFVEIARIMIGELQKALEEKQIIVRCTDAALAVIAKKAFSRKYGARNLRRYIQTEVEDKIAAEIISNYTKKLEAVGIDADGDNLSYSFI